MKLNNLKSFGIVAIALASVAIPVSASAQRYDHDSFRYDRRDVVNQVDQMERESNGFRFYFERNFRSSGHRDEHWDNTGRYSTPEHEGRNGQMTLKDAIQNLDETFEKLRSEVDHHGRTRRARQLMDDINGHSRDVDVRIRRVEETYTFTRDRRWHYDSSELYNRWQDLKSDINVLSSNFSGRRSF